MSDILIRGMEMPTEGQQKSFLLHFNDDGTANIVALGYPQKPYEVVPVPPHGDLIDRDKLEKDIDNYIGGEESRSRFHHWVQVQNTVIPMDKEADK